MRTNLLAASVLSAVYATAYADGIYAKNSPVLQVSGKDFSSLVEQSNHTSIVEFYAPWCGHCKNLKPAYEKAAKSLAGLAKVVAVNCDEESNKPLCGRMEVKGFPTLKIVKPGSKRGKPIIEDYQGARSAKAIVDAVVDKIPNHVKKVQDAELATWLAEGGLAKAILFTEKGTTAPLIKALAVDYLGSIDFATIRSKEKAAVQKYGVTKFPSIVLIPSGNEEPAMYDGDMKRTTLISFFSRIAAPNPDPAPKNTKAKTKASATKKTKPAASSASVSADFAKASEAHKFSEFDEHMQAHTIELNENMPTVSPLPIVEQDQQPMVIKEAAPPLQQLATAHELEAACLKPKSGNCILVLLPAQESTDAIDPLAAEVMASFAEVAEKHRKRRTNIFPFYGIPANNEAAKVIRKELDLKPSSELDIIALNMKRKWWRQFPASGYDIADAENFVDAIRLGEGTKQKLPADFHSGKPVVVEESAAPETEAEPSVEAAEPVDAKPEPASTAETRIHNEL